MIRLLKILAPIALLPALALAGCAGGAQASSGSGAIGSSTQPRAPAPGTSKQTFSRPPAPR